MRPDLADARLADRVFAPHYAMPVSRTLLTPATLRAGRDADADALAELASGDAFELLDVTGDAAWGIAAGRGLVGYLPAAALGA